MRALHAIVFSLGLTGMVLLSLACPYSGPHYPVTYGFTPTPTPPTTASVTIATSTFSPAAVTIGAGGTVVFQNNDAYPHTVDPSSGAACGTDNPVAASSAITVTFPTAGTIYYHCTIHAPTCNGVCNATCTGSMTGIVVVQ